MRLYLGVACNWQVKGTLTGERKGKFVLPCMSISAILSMHYMCLAFSRLKKKGMADPL